MTQLEGELGSEKYQTYRAKRKRLRNMSREELCAEIDRILDSAPGREEEKEEALVDLLEDSHDIVVAAERALKSEGPTEENFQFANKAFGLANAVLAMHEGSEEKLDPEEKAAADFLESPEFLDLQALILGDGKEEA